MKVFRRAEEPKIQGGSIDDEYITYEIERNKADCLAEWLRQWL